MIIIHRQCIQYLELVNKCNYFFIYSIFKDVLNNIIIVHLFKHKTFIQI